MTPSHISYSAEDPDHDSFSEELSPVNGFHPRDRGETSPARQAMMTQGPMFDNERPEAKTLIPTPTPHQASMRRALRRANHPVVTEASSSRTPTLSHQSDASPPASNNSLSPSSPPLRHSSLSRNSPFGPEPIYSEHTPLVNGPPPAYTPSPTSSNLAYTPAPTTPTSPISPTASRDPETPQRYSTFPDHRLERGITQPFLPRREPESMGRPADRLPDESPLLSNSKLMVPPNRTMIKRVLFSAVVLATIVALLTTTFHTKRATPDFDMPSQDRLIDAQGPYCSLATIRNDPVVYEFPTGTDLTLIQTTHDNAQERQMTSVRTNGEIRLRSLPSDSKHGSRPYFTVDVYVSHSDLQVVNNWDESSRTLKISTPQFARLGFSKPHCVSVEITAWIPESAEFTNLLVESITLGLRVMGDVKANISGRSKFATISGHVWFPSFSKKEGRQEQMIAVPQDQGLPPTLSGADSKHPFASRRVLVETVSGSIDGDYPLMDFLSLSTQSGSIKVGISPEKVLASAPAPADLEVQTASGSIHVELPVIGVPPPRNYITNVHSTSATIRGHYYLGSLASFKSTSGTLNLQVLPIIQTSSENAGDEVESRLETHTVSGSTRVEVLDPLFISHLSDEQELASSPERLDQYVPVGDDEPFIEFPSDRSLLKHAALTAKKKLRNLQSKHSSNSASVSVIYPSVWEGSIHAKTVSGDITVKGDGMRTVRDKKGWAFKEVLARKGVEGGEGSTAEMSDIAGNLKFSVRQVL